MVAWLIARGLSPLGARWILRGLAVALVALMLGSVYGAGYRAKGHIVTQRELKHERAKSAEVERLRKENVQLSAEVNAQKQRDRVVYRTITRQVPHVVREIVEVPVGGGPAVCTVNHDFVRLWNDALFARMPTPSSGTADPATRSDPAGDQSSGIRPGALLVNHVENAESCHDIRRQLRRLTDWHKAHGP